MAHTAILTGRLPMELGNAVSDAIYSALERGMDVDEAACVVVKVAVDYARGKYGVAYIDQLHEIMRNYARQPMPGRV